LLGFGSLWRDTALRAASNGEVTRGCHFTDTAVATHDFPVLADAVTRCAVPADASTGAMGLQSHRIETFKFSTEPQLEAKIRDVVGLYQRPPANAVRVTGNNPGDGTSVTGLATPSVLSGHSTNRLRAGSTVGSPTVGPVAVGSSTPPAVC
jgi:hypothetical protein